MRTARAILGGGLLAAAGVGFGLYGEGLWDPFPIAPAPESNFEPAPGTPVEDASGLGIGRAAQGFTIEQLARPLAPVTSGVAPVSTAVAWRATGKSFVPLEPASRGYAVDEPRLWIAGREGDATEVTAPLGTFTSPTAPGALRAELAGTGGRGVAVLQPHGSLETARLSLAIPADAHAVQVRDPGSIGKLNLARRALKARLETDSAVVARFRSGEASSVGTGSLVIEAEHGASAEADLERLVLHGPVHAHDDQGNLALEAREHVAVELERAPMAYMGWCDGLAGAAGGVAPLVPPFGRGGREYQLERLEAAGAVDLVLRRAGSPGQPPLDLHVAGEFVFADLGRGFLLVTGSPAIVDERGRGQSLRARAVVLRDRGENRIDFSALGDAELVTRLKKTRASVPGEWTLAGEEALGTLTNVADPGDPPELEVLDAGVWPAPRERVRVASRDGRVAGELDLLVLEHSRETHAQGVEVAGQRDTVRAFGGGLPLELATDESHVIARSLELVEEKNKPDVVHLRGDVRARLGSDVTAMAREGTAAVGSGGPWDLAGEAVDLDVSPKQIEKDRDLAWWEKTQLLRARASGDALLGGAVPSGERLRVAGRAIDLDLVKGKLAVAAAAGSRARAELGESFLEARRLDGDLRTGKLDAVGEVAGRRVLAPDPKGISRWVTLDAAKASATLEPDDARWKALRQARSRARKLGGHEVAPPAELLAATAEGAGGRRAVIAAWDGTVVDADRLDWDAAAGRGSATMRDETGRVHGRSPRGEALAREATIAAVASGAAGESYTLDLEGDVRLEGAGTERLALCADKGRATADVKATGRDRVSWGEVKAWSTGERPVVVASLEAEPTLEARGRVLRFFPGSREARFEGRPGEPCWFARGTGFVKALRANPGALEDPKVEPGAGVKPFAIRAPEATVVLAPDARRPARGRKLPREDREEAEERRAAEVLESLRSAHVAGPIVAREGERTIHATSLDYDGRTRCATLLGDPVRIADALGRVQETRRFVYRLGDPDVNHR